MTRKRRPAEGSAPAVPAPAPSPAPATPTSLPPIEASNVAETPRSARPASSPSSRRAQAEAEAEARLKAEAESAEAPIEAAEPIEADDLAEEPEKKASKPKVGPVSSLKTPETSSLSLAGGASGSLAGLSKAASTSSSTAHEYELSISRDPVSEPLRVRVLGKGGEGIAFVPPNVAFASFTFPAPLDLVTKVYVSYDDEEEETVRSPKTPARRKGKTRSAFGRVSLSDPSRGDARAFSCAGACWTRRIGGGAREGVGGAAGNGVRGGGKRRVARKDGREKKYWFSQARNESVWKERRREYDQGDALRASVGVRTARQGVVRW